jgi:hypothetical protein
MVRGVASHERRCRAAGHLGVGEGQMYLRSRITPVEGRTLASGVFAKEGRTGD